MIARMRFRWHRLAPVARRSRALPTALVTWRDGVHITGTPIWCDARRRRDICFISSAERVGRTGHGQLIASPVTLALLGAKLGGHLAVPLRQRFTLGTLRLELISSGRGLGAAALHVDIAGRTVLYAGAVRTTAGGFAEPAEVRSCDAVVVAAPFGEVHHEFPTVEDTTAQVVDWCQAHLGAGQVPVLAVDSVLDAIEVAARIVASGLTVAGTRSVRETITRLGELSALPAVKSIGREPTIVVALDGEKAKLPPGQVARTALVSGRALDLHRQRPGFDAAFAWPFVAGRTQLLSWIEQSKARDVFVTGEAAEAIVAAVGPRARVLGPPRQMALFGS